MFSNHRWIVVPEFEVICDGFFIDHFESKSACRLIYFRFLDDSEKLIFNILLAFKNADNKISHNPQSFIGVGMRRALCFVDK